MKLNEFVGQYDPETKIQIGTQVLDLGTAIALFEDFCPPAKQAEAKEHEASAVKFLARGLLQAGTLQPQHQDLTLDPKPST